MVLIYQTFTNIKGIIPLAAANPSQPPKGPNTSGDPCRYFYQKNIFYSICQYVGYNKNSLKISCQNCFIIYLD